MDDALLELVLDRLDDVKLPDRAADILLAACEGEGPLDAVLEGKTTGPPQRVVDRKPATPPAGAYLRSIGVQAFRGVGAATTLPLAAGPGLTVITGRNGSGKSSFAEGLEVLLTGRLRRWEHLPAVWREGWRNMHAAVPTVLWADLDVEDAGPAEVRREWQAGVDLNTSTATVQLRGQRRDDIARLGWADDLAAYRPFLSHAELEAFLSAKPSELYDLLESVLGLDDLTATTARLANARLGREKAVKLVRTSLAPLVERLAAIDDERATVCRDALTGTWDLERVDAIVTGTAPAEAAGALSRLRQLAQLTPPTIDALTIVATELIEAGERLDEVAGSDAGRAAALARLLRAALEHHARHGDGPCPVCGRDQALDDGWRQQTEKEIARLDREADEARQAAARADAAWAGLCALVQPPPAVLLDDTSDVTEVAEARARWEAWAAIPDRSAPQAFRCAVDHLTETWDPLVAAVEAVVRAAADELANCEDRWAPVATALRNWSVEARRATAGAEEVADLRRVERWLTDAIDAIRNDLFSPIAEEALSIWGELRQESNVTLESLQLKGSKTRRELDIGADVDGSPGAGLGVMSQGEVNALALSVFLPRAMMPESPFRFLVIDDPVQAMDSAKVDGLARVLDRVARDRQIVVFTHDDRLPQALRQLEIHATVLEVSRQPRSQVAVLPAMDPVQRALEDAEAVRCDRRLPPEVAARVAGGLCRLALEAALVEIVRSKMFRSGARHDAVEARLRTARTVHQKAALAMFGDVDRGSEVLPRLHQLDRQLADTFQALKGAAHQPVRGDLRSVTTGTAQLIERLRSSFA